MRLTLILGISVISATLGCALAVAQEYVTSNSAPAASATNPAADPVPLEWVPPALAQLSSTAPVKSNFTLDRTMLGIAAGLVPDSDVPTRQAINKLDGVSVPRPVTPWSKDWNRKAASLPDPRGPVARP